MCVPIITKLIPVDKKAAKAQNEESARHMKNTMYRGEKGRQHVQSRWTNTNNQNKTKNTPITQETNGVFQVTSCIFSHSEGPENLTKRTPNSGQSRRESGGVYCSSLDFIWYQILPWPQVPTFPNSTKTTILFHFSVLFYCVWKWQSHVEFDDSDIFQRSWNTVVSTTLLCHVFF